MRKTASIALILILLFSGIRVSFDTHFCCGHVAGRVVSLNGMKASCGMETAAQDDSGLLSIRNHCCHNETHTYSISVNYFPSFGKSDNSPSRSAGGINYITNIPETKGINISGSSLTGSPPGFFFPGEVSLFSICTLRI